ncbi:MAG: tRNA threonylcarbamoyladenosine dehydratase [Syntrophaceae bacterium]|jgi:tRNA threonylcarbamoyladenosine dehydratase|nr:tRNA threonylcarbamoyladenosine dehydratase [Syntrophaceae bacterium]
MEESIFSRSIMLYGPEGFDRLQKSNVAIVGMGGVGSYAAEALVRAGIGRLRIVDCDIVKATDINRQLIALWNNIGIPKVQAGKERLLAINPSLKLDACHAFFHFDTAEEILSPDLDFVVDAIDSLNPKAALIRHCMEKNLPMISALGASSRTDPFLIRIGRLNETEVCPLARALRRHLRSKNVEANPPVVYSTQPPAPAIVLADGGEAPESSGPYQRGRKRRALPSISTVAGIFGLIAANYVLFELLQKTTRPR